MRRSSQVLQWVIGAVILIALPFAAREYVGGRALEAAFGRFDWRYAPPLVLLTGLYLALNGARFVLALRPVTSTSRRALFVAYLAGEAPALLPGGGVLRLALYRQLGVPFSASGPALLILGALEPGTLLLGALVAGLHLGVLPSGVLWGLAGAAALGAVLFLPWTRRNLTALLNRWGRRWKVEAFLTDSSRACALLLRSGALAPVAGLTVAMFAVQVYTLMLCFRAFGQRLDFMLALAAFTIPVLLSRFVPVPAGVGVVGAGMVGLLVTEGSANPAVATAAVAVFRLDTLLLVGLVGALVFFLAWRRVVALTEPR